MAKKKQPPRIVIDLGEDLVTIKVTMRGAEKINARILTRIIREIQRTRRLELKKLIHKVKLTKDDYAKKYKETKDGRRSSGGNDGEDGGNDRSIDELAKEIVGKL